ncbi:MAG: hypothetical protein M1816_006926 [Peltula sp. TS41687]|nr:MAG: hypothetical protein M1816_006926 [Peltula sp. TS41687]
MHDLRRQALESKKTVSRKAQSKQSSRTSSQTNSRTNSRANSRNPSRHNSDEEEGNLSDGTSWSVNSIDEVVSGEDAELQAPTWKADLGDVIEQILDRKRSSAAGREESLASFNRLTMGKYVYDEIHSKTEEILSAVLKSIKANSGEKEAVLALKALALIAVTDPSDSIYDLIHQAVKRAISDFESPAVKLSAIHALGAAAFFGGVVDEEALSIMEYLLEIVESDGHSIEAGDSAAVVTAALEEWGFLATRIEDLEEDSQTAMEAFVDQLESSDASVQIAAGENIALVYEKSFTEQEEDESSNGEEEDGDPEDNSSPDGPKMVKRYEPYRNVGQLTSQLSALASVSSRRLSKKDKKSLHTSFADVLNSVENPTRGPRYQNALNQETGKRYGSRMVVRVNRAGVMKIDKWWKLHRLQALRRILGGGFLVHYEKNAVVFDSLP